MSLLPNSFDQLGASIFRGQINIPEDSSGHFVKHPFVEIINP
jgi:hypothetical protein